MLLPRNGVSCSYGRIQILWFLLIFVFSVALFASFWDFVQEEYKTWILKKVASRNTKEVTNLLQSSDLNLSLNSSLTPLYNKGNVTPSFAFLRPCHTDLEQIRQTWPTTRLKLLINCNSFRPMIHLNYVTDPRDVTTLRGQEGRRCLQKFVQQYCYHSSDEKVPNIAHYVWFGDNIFESHHLVSVLSVIRFQAPCAVVFHGDKVPRGAYWRLLLTLVPNVLRMFLSPPDTIFGRKFKFIQHKADVARIQILSDFGGIYFDQDQLLLRSVNDLRVYACVMSHEHSRNLANSLILAQPKAEFLQLWYDQYRNFNPEVWGYHSTFVPLRLAKKNPKLLTIVGNRFVYPDLTNEAIKKVYTSRDYNLSNNYGLHLYSRWMHFNYSLTSAAALNTTLGDVWRDVLFGTTEMFECN